MKSGLKNIAQRGMCLLSLAVFLTLAMPLHVFAQADGDKLIKDEQIKLWRDGLGYVDLDDGCTGANPTLASNAAASGDSTGSNSGSWHSNLQPPYMVEQFAIEVLKDLAAKRGVDPSVTVTEEHVIAMVAFMIGEGGDIMNSSVFNPLNSTQGADGMSRPNPNGHIPIYTSFDAGVELTARTMVNPYENRLADVLTKKDSTAVQFMEALTYYNKYPGNKVWAIESQQDPMGYYAQRMDLLKRTRASYDDLASIQMGTERLEQKEGLRGDKTKLQFHPAGQVSSGTSSKTGFTADQASCATANNSGSSTGGCQGGDELKVPEGGVGVNVCYFAQCKLGTISGVDMCGCGCEPTSTLMIRATMEKNPNIEKPAVVSSILKAGGMQGCAGSFPRDWLKGYLGPLGYEVTKIHDRQDGPHLSLSDADLAKAKEMLGQGYLLMAHTPNWVNSARTTKTSGHYLLVRAVDAQGNFLVANPGTVTDRDVHVSPADIKVWLDEFYAVKKTGQQV